MASATRLCCFYGIGESVGRIIRRNVVVGANGVIELRIPELSAGTRAEISVRVDEHDANPARGFSRWIGAAKGGFTTADEADRYIRRERDTWCD